MFGYSTTLDRDYDKITMRNRQEALQLQQFDNYMYMYSLYKHNYKLQQAKLQPTVKLTTEPNIKPTTEPTVQSIIEPTVKSSSRKIQYLNSTNDTYDSNIRNAVLFLQATNHNNNYIIVRDIKTKKWMVPAGRLDYRETPLEGAIREFQEETSFTLDKSKLDLPIKYYDIIHSNNSRTRFFMTKTTQTFNTYKITNETDDLEYISMIDIKSNVSKSTKFNWYNLKTFTNLFSIGFI
jgi:8-oxo-dGTP pyrophosphatase MutT (NUDIX family)